MDEITNIVTDVTGDPTLPRSNERPCPECRHREAVFFQVVYYRGGTQNLAQTRKGKKTPGKEKKTPGKDFNKSA